MKSFSQYYFFISLLIISNSVFGQFLADTPAVNPMNPNPFQSYSGPKSITRNIKKDNKGNLWFASWEGVFKFDGSSFVNVTIDKTGSRFFSFIQDSKDHFWMGSIGSGVWYFDGQSFQNFTVKDGLANNNVLDIYEDSKGRIWFATEGGASYYDGETFTNLTTDNGLLNNDLNSIIEDKNGTFWLASRGELSLYDGKNFSTKKKPDGSAFINVRTLLKDNNGNIWLAGNDGLWRYDGNNLKRFSDKFTGYVYQDNNGNIWTSSEGDSGWMISRYDSSSLQQEFIPATVIYEDERMLFGIAEDENNKIWFGTLKGICIFDGIVVECSQ